MVRLRGGRVVTPGGVLAAGAIAFEDGIIAAVEPVAPAAPGDIDCDQCWIVPGFIDTHIHGTDGIDVLADPHGVAAVARLLPRYGVTGFCPTSVACTPQALADFLAAVASSRAASEPGAARVLGAHLESNFINPDYRGAQAAACLRWPPRLDEPSHTGGQFTGAAILDAIHAGRDAVRIVTLAPELPGGLDLVRQLTQAGHRVSMGHSAATFDEAHAAIAAGARHATHLFNRMPPMSHRAPGLAGAVLAANDVICEVICDGHHVHPAWVQVAVRAKGPDGVAAITDATAGAGLPVGTTARLGESRIHVGARTATLEDGTMAGSITTMDAVFRWLLRDVGLGIADVVRLTAETPATALGQARLGRLAVGAAADCVVLDERFRVRQTWVDGRLAWNSGPGPDVSPTGRHR